MRDEDISPCPRCGSTNIRNDFPKFHCRECGLTWDIDEEERMIHERD